MSGLAEALAGRGIGVLRFNFPYAEEGRARPDPEAILIETWLHVLHEALPEGAFPSLPRLAGGRSLGARMATLAAARHPGEFRPRIMLFLVHPRASDRLRTGILPEWAFRVFLSGRRVHHPS
jgi:predicted alpha/beta-hydrolase family hydrolase